MDIVSRRRVKYMKRSQMPKRICLGSVSFICSGNEAQWSPKSLAQVNQCRAAHMSDRCLELLKLAKQSGAQVVE